MTTKPAEMNPTRRCDALDARGHRCRRKAVVAESYHGDSEIYSFNQNQPTWVRVEFCAGHAGKHNVNKMEVLK